MSSPNLGRASVWLASGTMVSRVLGFVKAIMLVQVIGVIGLATDAFSVANQLPNTVYAVIAGGVLNAIFVPQIVRAARHSDGGTGYINKLVTLALCLLAITTLFATLGAGALVTLVARTAPAEQISLATAMAFWCLPQIFFYGLYSVLGEVLNARNSFGPFTWAPVLNNVIAIGGLMAFVLLFEPTGADRLDVAFWTHEKIAVLAGSATLGVAAQALVLFLFWKRIGLRYRPDFRFRGAGLSTAGKLAGWTFGMLLLTTMAGIVETNVVISASGDNASATVVTSAWLIFMLPHSIVAVSIATAYFTRMSEHAATNSLAAVRADLSTSLRIITVLMVLAAAMLAVFAYPFSGIFTGFDFSSSVAMGNVVIAFLVGLPAFSVLFVLQRAFYALGDTRTPFFITLFQVIIFTAGALLMLALLPKENLAVGVALTLSGSTILQAILAAILIRRRLGAIGGRTIVASLGKDAAAVVPALAIGLGAAFYLGFFGASGFANSGYVRAILGMMTVAVVMGSVYLGVLRLCRSREVDTAVAVVSARLSRRRS